MNAGTQIARFYDGKLLQLPVVLRIEHHGKCKNRESGAHIGAPVFPEPVPSQLGK